VNSYNFYYEFHNQEIKQLMAASYLVDLLISPNKNDVDVAKGIISMKAQNREYLLVFKFLSGLIMNIQEQQLREKTQEIFLDCITKNDDNIIKIHGDYTIKLLMHILSQTILNSDNIPNAPEQIINRVNNVIREDIEKWSENIIKSQYTSSDIIEHLNNLPNYLLGLQVLPHLDINTPNLINQLDYELQNTHNLYDIANHIDSLKKLSSDPAASDVIRKYISSNNPFVKLMVISALGEIASDDNIHSLLQVLSTERSNTFAIIETVDALKNFKDSKNYESLLTSIINIMSEHHIDQNIITNKCLETMQSFGVDINDIEKRLVKLYEPFHDNTYKYMNVLANIYNLNLGNIQFTNIPNTQDDVYDMWNRKFRITWGADVNCRGKIIEILSLKYNHLSKDLCETYFNWLINRFNTLGMITPYGPPQQQVKNTILDSLGNIFPHLSIEQQDKAFTALFTRKTIPSRTTVVTNYHKIIPFLTPVQLNEVKNRIINKIRNNLGDNVRKIVFEELFLIKSKIPDNKITEGFFEDIIKVFMQIEDPTLITIDSLGKLASCANEDTLQAILLLLFDKISVNEALYRQKEYLEAINTITELFVQRNIIFSQEIVNSLFTLIKNNIRFLNQNSRTSDLQKIIYETVGSLARLSIEETQENLIIDWLWNNYQDVSITSKVKSYIVDGLTKALKNTNHAKMLEIMNSLMLFKNIDNILYVSIVHFIQELKIEGYIETEQNTKIIEFLNLPCSQIETKNIQKWAMVGFMSELDEDRQNTIVEFIVKKYLSYSDAFSSKELQYIYNVCSIIIRQAIKINNHSLHKVISYMLMKVNFVNLEFVKNLIEEINTFKQTYKIKHLLNLQKILSYSPVLSEIVENELAELDNLLPNILTNDDFHKFISEIHNKDDHVDISFSRRGSITISGRRTLLRLDSREASKIYDSLKDESIIKLDNQKSQHISVIDANKLNINWIKFSILKDIDSGVSLLISEEVTEFGDTRIVKTLKSSSSQHIEEVFHDIKIETLQNIFGPPVELKTYQISTFNVAKEQRDETITLFLNENLHFEGNIKTVKHNDLIGLSSNILTKLNNIENQLSSVHIKMDSLTQQNDGINDILKGIDLKSDIMRELLLNLGTSNLVVAPKNYSPYQSSLYATIVKQLMANYLMSVTMVRNPESILGTASDLIKATGEFVPVAGPGLKFLGSILSSIDKAIKETATENIANIALTPSSMETISKNIADFFASNNVNLDQTAIIDRIPELLSNIKYYASIEGLTQEIIELCKSNKSPLTQQEELGIEDGTMIVNYILIPYLSATKFNIIDKESDNIIKIREYLLSNNFVAFKETLISTISAEENNNIEIALTEEFLKSLNDENSRIMKSRSRDYLPDASSREPSPMASSITPSSTTNSLNSRGRRFSFSNIHPYDDNEVKQKPQDSPENTKYDGDHFYITNQNNIHSPLKRDRSDGSRYQPIESAKPTNAAPEQNQHTANNVNIQADYSKFMALTGAGIMNFAESIPSLQYLFKHYIPIMPYVDEAYDALGLTQYSNEINTLIYTSGGIALGCSVGSVQCLSVLPFAAMYYLKPNAYHIRDMLLNAIKQLDYKEGNSYLFEAFKFITYVTTEVTVSYIISSQFTDKTSFQHSDLASAAIGILHYFEQNKEVSLIANNTAFILTTAAGIATASNIKNPTDFILHFPVITAVMAMTHQITKFASDAVYGYFNPCYIEQNEQNINLGVCNVNDILETLV
jgi:hypothetical protein